MEKKLGKFESIGEQVWNAIEKLTLAGAATALMVAPLLTCSGCSAQPEEKKAKIEFAGSQTAVDKCIKKCASNISENYSQEDAMDYLADCAEKCDDLARF